MFKTNKKRFISQHNKSGVDSYVLLACTLGALAIFLLGNAGML